MLTFMQGRHWNRCRGSLCWILVFVPHSQSHYTIWWDSRKILLKVVSCIWNDIHACIYVYASIRLYRRQYWHMQGRLWNRGRDSPSPNSYLSIPMHSVTRYGGNCSRHESWGTIVRKEIHRILGAEDPVPRAVVKIGKGKTSICHLCYEDFVDTTLHLHMGSWGWNNRVEEASKRFPLVSVEGVPNYDHSLPS